MMQTTSKTVDFFLGATTPAGFKGYFEPLRREPGMQMYLIKSGPGCGKSTLMKQLAQKAEQQGQPIERIHCASDPDSLDGVVFLEKRAAIVDATAPHVLEPDAPGADEIVVSLYHTIRRRGPALPTARKSKPCSARNAPLRGRAARYIASAGSLLLDSRRAEACSANFEKVRRYVKRLCTRMLPRLPDAGPRQRGAAAAVGHHAQGAGLLPRDGAGAGRPVRRLPGRLRGRLPAAAGAYPGRGAGPGLPHHHLPLRHAPRRPRSTTSSSRPCGWPSSRTTAGTPSSMPGVQAVRCTRFLDRENLAGFRARLRFNERAAARAAGPGRRPHGTGQELPR